MRTAGSPLQSHAEQEYRRSVEHSANEPKLPIHAKDCSLPVLLGRSRPGIIDEVHVDEKSPNSCNLLKK